MDKKYIIIHVHGEGKNSAWRNLFNYDTEIKRIDTKKGYIIIPIYNSSMESEKIKECLSNIIEKNKIIGEIYICAHCKSFSLEGVKVKTYLGTNSYAYCLIDLSTRKYGKESVSYAFNLQKNCKKFPDFDAVKKNLGFEPDPKKVILSALTPLHLSLQAFFGISRDISEKSEVRSGKEEVEFVKFGNRKDNGDNIIKSINEKRDELIKVKGDDQIDDGYKNLFPNPDAFLLVPEAEWDFYAPLFDMILSSRDKKDGAGVRDEFNNDHTPDEEKEMYGRVDGDKYTVAEMLMKIDETKFKDFISAFDKPIPAKWSKVQIDSKNSTVKPSLFVACLREIAAILANTVEKDKNCCKKDVYFGYKGKYGRYYHKILQGLGKNFSKPHCKLEEKKDDKDYGYDKTLKEQIVTWGIAKAMVVIAGIEEMAEELTEL